MNPRLLAGFAGVFGWLLTAPAVWAQPGPVLTNAADVLALPAAQAAAGMRVALKGVVTTAEPNWNGPFFLQDATGGIFVGNWNGRHPVVGDLVEVSGVTHPGDFAPVIQQPRWRVVGTAPLPEAKPVPIERLMSGAEDSQRVEISGIVRSVQVEPNQRLGVNLMSGGFRLNVFPPIPPGIDPQKLVGAKVRVRGTAAASVNALQRRLITMVLFVPRLDDFIVEEQDAADPFNLPALPLNSIAQYRNDPAPGKRVHVRGIVSHQRLGEDLFIHDPTGSLRIRTRQLESLSPGDAVEVVGFPDFEHFFPVMQDAIFRKTPEPAAAVTPQLATETELQAGLHYADFITLRGKLLDRIITSNQDRPEAGPYLRTVLMLQGSNLLFTAQLDTATNSSPALTDIPLGSIVEVSGVCVSEIGEAGKLASVQIFLPTAQSFRVLQRPSWWTPQRLLIGLGAVFAVLLIAIAWTVIISRKNFALKMLVAEKEQAQIELRHANDRLEERVKERTEQLKLQITARQESELQFQAVLNERTRLAQELHDTLEQTLIGIALQLDIAAKCAPNDGPRSQHHLELARNLVTQSQVEVRSSVWDLRSRSLETLDLPGLLHKISQKLTEGAGIQVNITTQGRVRPLPEIIEDNLLRVAQEALTNLIKHSKATLATIALDYGPKNVVLQVNDNGSGFVVGEQAGPGQGHFGLLGITERTKRLSGHLSITSNPATGTTVLVTIPIDPPPDSGPGLGPPKLTS